MTTTDAQGRTWLIHKDNIELFMKEMNVIIQKYADELIHRADFDAQFDDLLEMYGAMVQGDEEMSPDYIEWHEGPMI